MAAVPVWLWLLCLCLWLLGLCACVAAVPVVWRWRWVGGGCQLSCHVSLSESLRTATWTRCLHPQPSPPTRWGSSSPGRRFTTPRQQRLPPVSRRRPWRTQAVVWVLRRFESDLVWCVWPGICVSVYLCIRVCVAVCVWLWLCGSDGGGNVRVCATATCVCVTVVGCRWGCQAPRPRWMMATTPRRLQLDVHRTSPTCRRPSTPRSWG